MAVDTPKWVKNAVIYGVYPRNHSADGTFMDIFSDLERIKSLYTDVLWLMPVYPIGIVDRQGTLGNPYAVRNYRAVNPELGDPRALKMVIDKAHYLDMKVIIDIVYNHTSKDSVLFTEHPEWFLKDPKGEFFTKVPDRTDVYDLDYRSSDLWEYQIETLEQWAEFGVDGFRCDLASLVPLDFWLAARERLKRKSDREILWIAGSIEKSFVKYIRDRGYKAYSDPELHEAFDLTCDYDGFEYITDYFHGKRPLRDYLNYLHIQETLYPENAAKLRFLEDYRTPRAADFIRSRDSLLNWLVFYTLLPGATLVYTGQEIGAETTPSLYEKGPINLEDADVELMSFMQKVLGLAKDIKAGCDKFSVEEPAEGIIKLTWRSNNVAYVALLNMANKYGEIHIDGLRQAEVCLGNADDLRVFPMERMPFILKTLIV
ncbi:MAG: alpha-amylase family glycosyl hydrolase [Bacillota bacterium]|nr:alpha-amylase family glycosyl hydrolase [Bacillota bacterium]MDI9415027.1 alpha-amylase family glycosyl hydrolase [Bacillota bacterium]NLD12640.1 alpha-amylase [Bacillota bacterium]HAV20530.1 alpha-amylase [Bacillota bacterium]HOB88717.1 alpha-amylase family glycosyl hydrolase [Bacillota bacterium]